MQGDISAASCNRGGAGAVPDGRRSRKYCVELDDDLTENPKETILFESVLSFKSLAREGEGLIVFFLRDFKCSSIVLESFITTLIPGKGQIIGNTLRNRKSDIFQYFFVQ